MAPERGAHMQGPKRTSNMKLILGKTHLSLVIPYRGPGRRWGKINFANGYTLRAGVVAVHIWQPNAEGAL